MDLSLEDSVHVFEIIEARLKQTSTIFCSQFSPEGWHEKIKHTQLADAILDRIKHNSHQILVDGEVSMRERHGLEGTKWFQLKLKLESLFFYFRRHLPEDIDLNLSSLLLPYYLDEENKPSADEMVNLAIKFLEQALKEYE